MLTPRILHPEMLSGANERALFNLEAPAKTPNTNKDTSDFLDAYNTWLSTTYSRVTASPISTTTHAPLTW